VALPGRRRQEHSAVHVYLSGKVLRRIVASKDFAEKFQLPFTKKTADILLVAMMSVKVDKDFRQNLGRRYFIQADAWQKEPTVKLRVASPQHKKHFSATEIKPDEPYAWTFKGSLVWRHLLLGIIVGCFFLACLFPVWPDFMKLGVWYLSVTILIFLFCFFMLRAIIFIIVWVAGYDFWILPNILDDDLPPIESFKPLYALEAHTQSRSGWMYRISVGVVLFATAYWVYVQPNAYHAAFLEEQRNFVDELYNGKLLPDRSAAASENLDDVIPDYEALLQEELADQQQELTPEEQAEADILAEILKEDYADEDDDEE